VPDLICKNCGREVAFDGGTADGYDTDYTHTFGIRIRRCLPADSCRPWGERLQADVDVPEVPDE
jgi:hypothetical protein